MKEYLPWSSIEFSKACQEYASGRFAILDIELGGMCNMKCIYCDSPDRTKSFTAKQEIYSLIRSQHFRWLFICGLGEPTFSDNKRELLNILELCKKHGVKCSMFSNLVDFDEVLFQYVEAEVLYVMFKLDSFDPKLVRHIYGSPSLDTDKLFHNLKRLTALVKIHENCTNLCASIVPTSLNVNELPSIFNFCEEHNIFPLIGDLEDSGRGKDTYMELKLTDTQLQEVKDMFGVEYRIPICPSVLCGIHILYDGTVALDKSTGLSCHWFWLTEPVVHELEKIQNYCSLEEVEKRVLEYRWSRIPYVERKAKEIQSLVFGGCGGDIKELLDKYLELHKKISHSM